MPTSLLFFFFFILAAFSLEVFSTAVKLYLSLTDPALTATCTLTQVPAKTNLLT